MMFRLLFATGWLLLLNISAGARLLPSGKRQSTINVKHIQSSFTSFFTPSSLPSGKRQSTINVKHIQSSFTSFFTPSSSSVSLSLLLNDIRGGDGNGGGSNGAAPLSSAVVVDDALMNSFDLFGTAVFAFSGAVTAGKKGMDLLGMIIIACITSIGGGTVRDVLMFGRHSANGGGVFWVSQIIYIKICVIVAIITFFFYPWLENKFDFNDSAVPVCVADAIGLAAFAILGTQKATEKGLDILICVLSGLITATFGGVTRDVLCQQRPRIMYPHRTMYAAPAIVGSIVYIILSSIMANRQQQQPIIHLVGGWITLNGSAAIAYISFLVTFITRLLSFNNPRRLPHWKTNNIPPSD